MWLHGPITPEPCRRPETTSPKINPLTQPTLFEQIWDYHLVDQSPGAPAVLYIDLHLVHEVTSPQAFSGLRQRGLKVRRPDKTVATIDHSVPTLTGTTRANGLCRCSPMTRSASLSSNCHDFGVPLFDLDRPQAGHRPYHRA